MALYDKEYQKKIRERYKERHPGRSIALYRQRKFGITPEEFQQLLEQQNHRCSLCKQPETARWRGKVKNLAVDHDHKTGKVRSLLCHRCNTGLGSFRESVSLMSAAIEYLQKHS